MTAHAQVVDIGPLNKIFPGTDPGPGMSKIPRVQTELQHALNNDFRFKMMWLAPARRTSASSSLHMVFLQSSSLVKVRVAGRGGPGARQGWGKLEELEAAMFPITAEFQTSILANS